MNFDVKKNKLEDNDTDMELKFSAKPKSTIVSDTSPLFE